WFLASTDFGLGSQWLDMTSYDHEETSALYFAVLNKNDPSPLMPESDEETGVPAAGTGGGRGGRNGSGGGGVAAADSAGAPAAAPAPRGPVNVTIDFDGLAGRIIAVPGVASRRYSKLKAGAAGTVFFSETVAASGTAGNGASTLHRYQLRDRRAVPFATAIADY